MDISVDGLPSSGSSDSDRGSIPTVRFKWTLSKNELKEDVLTEEKVDAFLLADFNLTLSTVDGEWTTGLYYLEDMNLRLAAKECVSKRTHDLRVRILEAAKGSVVAYGY